MKRVVVLIGVVLLLAACGGGGNSDADQVKHVWTSFFSAKTPVSQKPAMLQDGQRFKSAITTLASNPLASQLSAKVSSVTLEGAAKAKVVYSIYLGNTAVFRNQVGYAFKQNGKWLVGYAGLCNLMERAGQLPSTCTT
jgi:ABC-type glycerol-3-phosphate transport system substrate-binding protein